jgi:hypothetical protein
MVDRPGLTFGIKTAPQHDARYEAIARVWREADATPEFEHAWLWDHMMPPRRLLGASTGPSMHAPALA